MVQYESALSIASYCLSSILMTVTNKLVLSSYNFKLNFLLLAIQSLVCVVLLEFFTFLGLTKHKKFSKSDAKSWFIVSLMLVLMIYSGSKAIQYLPIPLFTVFKNMTIIAIAFSEQFFLKGPKVTGWMLCSFSLIVLSSIVSGWDDLSSPSANIGLIVLGYSWMFFNCVSTCLFTLLMKSQIKRVNFKDFDTVFYNNLLAVPVLTLLFLYVELDELFVLLDKYSNDTTNEFFYLSMGIIISSVCSFGISYSTAWCVRVTSSTTYSMVGSLNKLPIAIAGMVFFETRVTFMSLLGVFLALNAGLVYSYAKTRRDTLPVYKLVK